MFLPHFAHRESPSDHQKVGGCPGRIQMFSDLSSHLLSLHKKNEEGLFMTVVSCAIFVAHSQSTFIVIKCTNSKDRKMSRGAVGKSTCQQAWWPQFCPSEAHGIREEPTPLVVPWSHTHMRAPFPPTHTHTHASSTYNAKGKQMQ